MTLVFERSEFGLAGAKIQDPCVKGYVEEAYDNMKGNQMAIYKEGRVESELKRLQDSQDWSDITINDLLKFDQMHYGGASAVDDAAKKLGVRPGSEILDAGAGYGGPARYMSHAYNCDVTAIELQPQIHMVAEYMTRQLGLSNHLHHMRASITNPTAVPPNTFDGAMSMLVILHITDRRAVFDTIYRGLKPGAKLYVEDYYLAGPMTASEREDLRHVVACPYLPTEARYRQDLKDAGFVDLEWEDATDEWTICCTDRANAFRADWDRHVSVYGEKLTLTLDRFYTVVAQLFEGGNLGGVKYCVTKPKHPAGSTSPVGER
eukprot:comp18456_c0_seq1/m.19750 comp18456_c0_seq1/g.19750  ORF comp18456_c0_seq1/g.19750 comp18456_c0_seq1/m.19750 type:complete len:319 (-) comp18456_c0_seq1:134-1090(-)